MEVRKRCHAAISLAKLVILLLGTQIPSAQNVLHFVWHKHSLCHSIMHTQSRMSIAHVVNTRVQVQTLNFSGIEEARCGRCESPKTRTSSPKSPIVACTPDLPHLDAKLAVTLLRRRDSFVAWLMRRALLLGGDIGSHA
jgi:hypothetical protein